MRTLLAVSDKNINIAIQADLTSKSIQVDSVSTALDAYHCLNRHEYNIAIIDYDLPDLDGLLIADWLKKEDKDIKIILISSKNSIDLSQKAESLKLIHFNKSECEEGIFRKLVEKNLI
jgi:DNA-binding response OmpR family regulator